MDGNVRWRKTTALLAVLLVGRAIVQGDGQQTSASRLQQGTYTVEQVPMGSLWYVNPLGFLQLGPVVGAEWRLSDTISLDTHWRYSALGALYHLVATGLTGNELNPLSMALGAGPVVSLAIPRSSNVFCISVRSEYGWGGVSGGTGGRPWTSEHAYIAVACTVGYRWRWPVSRWLLHFLHCGIGIGSAFIVTDRWWYHDAPTAVFATPLDRRDFWVLELSFCRGF